MLSVAVVLLVLDDLAPLALGIIFGLVLFDIYMAFFSERSTDRTRYGR